MIKATESIITKLEPNQIFVFGSNTEGIHGSGAAHAARKNFKAIYSVPMGLQGQSYGIITKHLPGGMRSVTKQFITDQFKVFFRFITYHPDMEFLITRIGCELAGFSESEIVACIVVGYKRALEPISEDQRPTNFTLPQEFLDIIRRNKFYGVSW